MSDSTYSTTNETPRNNSRNALIWGLGIALLGVTTFLIIDKSKSSTVIDQQQSQLSQVTDEKSDIQKSFDGSLARLDSMAGINTALQSKLTERNDEITKAKAEIRSILNKKNASASELARAKGLIATLNENITGMQEEIARLTQDNQTLTQDKVALTQDKEILTREKQTLDSNLTATNVAKQDLEKKVDVASTLNATNIAIIPVNVKSNGKEKETTTAKRVDKFLIRFDVDNRIAQPGTTDVYVVVTGPDGNPVTAQTLGSGTFTTREEGEKSFTAKVPVDVETAKRKNVEFAFVPGANFKQGSYTIQIYQNGFKIGESTRQLKKGGLFS